VFAVYSVSCLPDLANNIDLRGDIAAQGIASFDRHPAIPKAGQKYPLHQSVHLDLPAST
jgi:hypothetical protein